MTFRSDIGVIDLMIGFPFVDKHAVYDYLYAVIKDDQSKEAQFPVGYMFKDTPEELGDHDPIDYTFSRMNTHNISAGLFSISGIALEARRKFPNRVFLSLEIDPNDITGTVRKIRNIHAEHGLTAVTTFPAGCNPQVPVSDRRYYPIYQTCVDLDLPIIANAGVPGPRVPAACQHVEHFDQVCYDFPELRIVMRHGAEPWEDLAVKLMLKWPGLYYMTSAFAPKYFPQAIIDYANTRGMDKIMYAGYFPAGLTIERMFSELPDVAFRDHVWPNFLRNNAIKVFNLNLTPQE
ncbi:MAG: amidohydrolase family protein [Actinobacteria bacterium]|nr:amidohydrolase family protein [Actinomycetota bacterium]